MKVASTFLENKHPLKQPIFRSLGFVCFFFWSLGEAAQCCEIFVTKAPILPWSGSFSGGEGFHPSQNAMKIQVSVLLWFTRTHILFLSWMFFLFWVGQQVWEDTNCRQQWIAWLSRIRTWFGNPSHKRSTEVFHVNPADYNLKPQHRLHLPPAQ